MNAQTSCHTIATGILFACLFVVGPGTAVAHPPDWSSLPLPGARAELCRVAGLDPETDASRLPFELVRILYGTPAGAPPADARTSAAVLGYLRTAPDSKAQRHETLPSPLPADTWRGLLSAPADDAHLFGAIMSSRQAALLFYGLAALDADTLHSVRGDAGLLKWLARERPGTLAACAGGLHVTREGVQVPGGRGAEPLWASLVGKPPSSADAFIRALFSRDLGKLAYFYDTVASLDEAHRRFAFGLDDPKKPKEQPRRFRSLYSAFADMDPAWSLEIGPFTRRVDDGRMLLGSVAVTPDGALAAPSSIRLWHNVFGLAAPYERPFDAATLAALVLNRDWHLRRQRLRSVLFAQRVFGSADPRADLVPAIQGFLHFETLHLTLERMGITDPLAYAKASERAAELKAPTLLSEFQGALALIDRCAFRGTLDLPARRRLLDALLVLPLDPETGYAGGIARWFDSSFLPELRLALKGSAAESAEDLVLEGLAGLLPPTASSLPIVRWEDHNYRIDQGAGELTRLLQVRTRQGGNRLDDVLSLEALAAKLLAGEAADPARLLSLSKKLQAPELRSDGGNWLTRDLTEGVTLGEVHRTIADGQRVKPQTVRRVVALADEMLGAVLRSLAYAAHIGDPENNVLLGPNLADDHDFGLSQPPAPPLVNGWALPYERMGGGAAWHVDGSLLCLDVILGRYSLPRPVNAPPGPRRVSRRDEQALAHASVLARAADFSDAERDAIAASIQEGRARVKAATEPDAVLALAALAKLDSLRANQLAWSVAHGGELTGALTTTDLWRMGGDAPPAPPAAAWGASSVGLDGCPFLRFPAGPPPDGYGWLPSAAAGVSGVPDISLRLAEITAKLHVPGALVALLLPDATQELLERARPSHSDDWMALATAAAGLSEERRGDMVAAFTAVGGPLVPLPSSVKHD